MKDGQVSFSVGCAIAWALWSLSIATLMMAVTYGIHELAAFAIVAAIAAGTATMRTYYVRQNRIMRGYAKLILDGQEQVTAESLIPVR